MTPDIAYTHLVSHSQQIAFFDSSCSLLHWDQETGMPPSAESWRARHVAFLAGMAHRMATASERGDWISTCEQAGWCQDDVRSGHLRWWRRTYDRACRMSAEDIEKDQELAVLAHSPWVEARQRSDFSIFAPWLEKIVERCRHRAKKIGGAETLYDVLLEDHEPGSTTQSLEKLFGRLGAELSALISRAGGGDSDLPVDLLAGDYPVERQILLNKQVLDAIGFDWKAGRMDTAAHPFCTTIGPGDCRLTNRYDPHHFTASLFGALHEAGHGLYEQGLPIAEVGTPSFQAPSLGIHESQSRLWENHIGRSEAFWDSWFGPAADLFPSLRHIGPDRFLRAIRRVRPSLIRVEADETTYPLHIILRFEMEKDLIAGDLTVQDLPARWNERFEQLLGLPVPDDAQGVLQDIHWSSNAMGYFPTYALGTVRAAQLHQAADRDLGGLDAQVRANSFAPLLGWLREHVHRWGATRMPEELMLAATGQETSPDAFLARARSLITTSPS